MLPSLTPSLGRTDEGWAARVEVWKDPRVMLGGSDAGAHLDLMCHANYPTVVLGEVVRDRGLLSLEEAVRDDDRPPGPPLRAARAGAGSPRAGTPTWWCSTRTESPASRPRLLHDLPGGGERLLRRIARACTACSWPDAKWSGTGR